MEKNWKCIQNEENFQFGWAICTNRLLLRRILNICQNIQFRNLLFGKCVCMLACSIGSLGAIFAVFPTKLCLVWHLFDMVFGNRAGIDKVSERNGYIFGLRPDDTRDA